MNKKLLLMVKNVIETIIIIALAVMISTFAIKGLNFIGKAIGEYPSVKAEDRLAYIEYDTIVVNISKEGYSHNLHRLARQVSLPDGAEIYSWINEVCYLNGLQNHDLRFDIPEEKAEKLRLPVKKRKKSSY